MSGSRRKKLSTKKGARPSQVSIPIPPRLQPNPVRKIVKRYTNNATFGGQTFTQADLYNQFLIVVATTGNCVPYVDMVRIRKIRVWSYGTGSLTVLQPLDGDVNNQFASPERTYSITPLGTAQTGYMEIRPRGSTDPLGGWKETSNVNFAQTLFTLTTTCTAGNLIIDVLYEYIENCVGGPNGYAFLSSTTVLGTVGGEKWAGGAMVVVGQNAL